MPRFDDASTIKSYMVASTGHLKSTYCPICRYHAILEGPPTMKASDWNWNLSRLPEPAKVVATYIIGTRPSPNAMIQFAVTPNHHATEVAAVQEAQRLVAKDGKTRDIFVRYARVEPIAPEIQTRVTYAE